MTELVAKPIKTSKIREGLKLTVDIGKLIFEGTVRPDWKRGNSTWIGDFAPAGIGLANYMRRIYDQTGCGTEIPYIFFQAVYQTATGVALYQGLTKLFS